jgi:hypothetical protein
VNEKEFWNINDKIPLYVSVFKLVKVPKWAVGLHKGDLFYYHPLTGGMRLYVLDVDGKIIPKPLWSIRPSYFKFVEYKKV